MRFQFILALIVILATGCKSENDQGAAEMQKLKDAQANSSQAHFENSEDPPFTAHTHFAAGQLAESMGQQDRAIGQYNEAIRLDPKDQPSLYRLGVLYAQLHQYSQAIDAWKQYVRATNGSATAHSNLAFCYELAGRFSEAESAYTAGIKQEPSNQSCRVNYGLMLARQGKIDDAVKQLSAVLKPAQVHYNLAAVYDQQGKKDQAKSEYEKALELDPSLSEAQMRLSRLE